MHAVGEGKDRQMEGKYAVFALKKSEKLEYYVAFIREERGIEGRRAGKQAEVDVAVFGTFC